MVFEMGSSTKIGWTGFFLGLNQLKSQFPWCICEQAASDSK